MGNKSSSARDDREDDAEIVHYQEFGRFELSYLGTAPVPQSTGEEMVHEAVKRIISAKQVRKKVPSYSVLLRCALPSCFWEVGDCRVSRVSHAPHALTCLS